MFENDFYDAEIYEEEYDEMINILKEGWKVWVFKKGDGVGIKFSTPLFLLCNKKGE